MADGRTGGPQGSRSNSTRIDSGSLVRTASPRPGVIEWSDDDRRAFEHAIQSLEAEVANIGAHLSIDSNARRAYANQIRALAEELATEANAGRTSWRLAAEKARRARNDIMEIVRSRSTPVGCAMAERLKSEGRTLNEMIARKAMQLFGPGTDFNSLTGNQKSRVYAEIVRSAGKSNPRVDAAMRRLSRAGRGLLFLSIAISVYEIANADDKVGTARRELAVTGAGIGGGIAGGVLAGLACGPGAPVCVTVGAFVGGALAAFGVDLFW
jgi:hypothetical protein